MFTYCCLESNADWASVLFSLLFPYLLHKMQLVKKSATNDFVWFSEIFHFTLFASWKFTHGVFPLQILITFKIFLWKHFERKKRSESMEVQENLLLKKIWEISFFDSSENCRKCTGEKRALIWTNRTYEFI